MCWSFNTVRDLSPFRVNWRFYGISESHLKVPFGFEDGAGEYLAGVRQSIDLFNESKNRPLTLLLRLVRRDNSQCVPQRLQDFK